MTKKEWYRRIPKMDVILQKTSMQSVCAVYGRKTVMETVNECLD